MGGEFGATSSVFPYDTHMADYLIKTGRGEIVKLAKTVARDLRADPEVYQAPEKYYDSVITIDLTTLEPQVSGPSQESMNSKEVRSDSLSLTTRMRGLSVMGAQVRKCRWFGF